MIPHYTYKSSSDFINELAFDYVETYSFQRGTEYELQQKKFDKEYEKLKSKKSNINNLSIKEEERLLFLDKLCNTTQYLLNDANQFHYSSKKTNSFKSVDLKVELLKNILNTEITEIPSWMCAPIYRDALAFYNKQGKIIAVLNICLSCLYMETTKFNHINGDWKTYDLLKCFFNDLGHSIENTENLALDDFEKMKDKFKLK